MRNPWVHDDVPDSVNDRYTGRVWLLGMIMWGLLAAIVITFILLWRAELINSNFDTAIASGTTYVTTALAAVVMFPIILKLLAISRLLAAITFLGSGWILARVVWEREAAQFEQLATGTKWFNEIKSSTDELIELLEILFSVVAVTL